ncbi:hypothetical protein [Mangrovivirga cuniculi]|uniref:Uncharacterized protein n=1 Tax=Mangrovivirga cuniculi TaxID=2715131 RepID=A0A4D7K1J2_9BACT|nr:hypothetical protein [Mangrovivirga cuniculi]QCK14734.1 hypothetical protein DCC35_08265 [Mangrovivirga cuniculi]
MKSCNQYKSLKVLGSFNLGFAIAIIFSNFFNGTLSISHLELTGYSFFFILGLLIFIPFSFKFVAGAPSKEIKSVFIYSLIIFLFTGIFLNLATPPLRYLFLVLGGIGTSLLLACYYRLCEGKTYSSWLYSALIFGIICGEFQLTLFNKLISIDLPLTTIVSIPTFIFGAYSLLFLKPKVEKKGIHRGMHLQSLRNYRDSLIFFGLIVGTCSFLLAKKLIEEASIHFEQNSIALISTCLLLVLTENKKNKAKQISTRLSITYIAGCTAFITGFISEFYMIDSLINFLYNLSLQTVLIFILIGLFDPINTYLKSNKTSLLSIYKTLYIGIIFFSLLILIDFTGLISSNYLEIQSIIITGILSIYGILYTPIRNSANKLRNNTHKMIESNL